MANVPFLVCWVVYVGSAFVSPFVSCSISPLGVSVDVQAASANNSPNAVRTDQTRPTKLTKPHQTIYEQADEGREKRDKKKRT